MQGELWAAQTLIGPETCTGTVLHNFLDGCTQHGGKRMVSMSRLFSCFSICLALPLPPIPSRRLTASRICGARRSSCHITRRLRLVPRHQVDTIVPLPLHLAKTRTPNMRRTLSHPATAQTGDHQQSSFQECPISVSGWHIVSLCWTERRVRVIALITLFAAVAALGSLRL